MKGKLGAVFGSYIFGALADVTSYPTVMLLCAAISLLGMYLTQRFIQEDEHTKKDRDGDGLIIHQSDEKLSSSFS